MKKFITLLISLMIFVALVFSVSAAVITPAEGYTAYPIVNNDNVKFYTVADNAEIKVTNLSNGALFGPNEYELQIWWSDPSHLAQFDFSGTTKSQGVAAHGEMYTEITFTGTAIRIGTCYRNIPAELGTSSAAKVEIDGTEYPCVANALKTENANDTTPTVFFEASGLKDKQHTVRIYNAETGFAGTRLNFDWYEIIPGTGADETPADTFDAGIAAAFVALVSAAGIMVVKKKR